MATQAEINQQLGTWAANFLLLMTKQSYFDSKTAAQLNSWFNTYIKSLYTQVGITTITLPTVSEMQNCRSFENTGKGRRGPAREVITKVKSAAYGNALITQIRALQSQLPGILNTLSISNAGTIVAEFNKIRIQLGSKVGCSKDKR
jgi:hypothetical protein